MGQMNTGQDDMGSGNASQNYSWQEGTGSSYAGYGYAGQGYAGQNYAGQGSAGQWNSGQRNDLGDGNSGRQRDRFFQWIRGSGIQRTQDRWIAGVCSGIAHALGWSPTLVRALMLASVLLFGFGMALYALAWLLLPDVEDNRIIAEALIAGQWDWAFLGPLLCLAVALIVPRGTGIVAVLLAGLALCILMNVAVHRRRGFSTPGGAAPGGSGSAGGAGPAGGPWVSDPTGARSGAGEFGTTGQSRTRNQPNGYTQAGSYGQPNQPSQPGQPGQPNPSASTGEFGQFAQTAAASQAHASSAYTTYQPQTNHRTATVATPQPPQYARRKPAGFLIVSLAFGAVLISVAWFMLGFFTVGGDLESLLQTSLRWSAVVLGLLGLVIIALGMVGRRSGGLIPLALLSAGVTIAILSVSAGYSYIYADMNRVNASYTKVVVPTSRQFGSSDEDMDMYAAGVAFTGSGIDGGQAHIDLSDYAQGRSPHELELTDGSVTESNCPTGVLAMTVYNTSVLITLPEGCSFRYVGDQYISTGQNRSKIGGSYSASIGGMTIGMDDFDGMTYLPEREYTVDGERAWAMSPELEIKASHVIQGQIQVEYADEPTSEGETS